MCKLNYEVFQGSCIPTQGCLTDAHCIKELTVCKGHKCVCKLDYVWNSTTGACIMLKKTLTDMPTMAVTASVKSTTPDSTSAVTSVMTSAVTSVMTSVMTSEPTVEPENTKKFRATSTEETVETVSDTSTGTMTTTGDPVKKALENDKPISPGGGHFRIVFIFIIVFNACVHILCTHVDCPNKSKCFI